MGEQTKPGFLNRSSPRLSYRSFDLDGFEPPTACANEVTDLYTTHKSSRGTIERGAPTRRRQEIEIPWLGSNQRSSRSLHHRQTAPGEQTRAGSCMTEVTARYTTGPRLVHYALVVVKHLLPMGDRLLELRPVAGRTPCQFDAQLPDAQDSHRPEGRAVEMVFHYVPRNNERRLRGRSGGVRKIWRSAFVTTSQPPC